MPHYLRFALPGSVPVDGYPGPELRARAMASLFIAIPEHELTVGRLETAAIMLTDRGTMEWATGDPMGEELAPWLFLIIAPGARRAFVDCDVEAMGRLQAKAEREYLKAARRG